MRHALVCPPLYKATRVEVEQAKTKHGRRTGKTQRKCHTTARPRFAPEKRRAKYHQNQNCQRKGRRLEVIFHQPRGQVLGVWLAVGRPPPEQLSHAGGVKQDAQPRPRERGAYG